MSDDEKVMIEVASFAGALVIGATRVAVNDLGAAETAKTIRELKEITWQISSMLNQFKVSV